MGTVDLELRNASPDTVFDGPEAMTVDMEDGVQDLRPRLTVYYILPGDLDGNGIINRDDIAIIMSYRNQPAAVCPECDIDGDGVITARDARKLMVMCTCPLCLCN